MSDLEDESPGEGVVVSCEPGLFQVSEYPITQCVPPGPLTRYHVFKEL